MNNSLISGTGLIDGKMGIAILLYHSSRITGCKSYQDTADSLLDKILAGIGSIDLSFSKGLAGIAFGLDHLIKYKFIDADPDDLLIDVDDKLFSSLITDSSKDFTNDFPLFSYGLYIDKRIKSHQAINIGIDYLIRKGIQICENFLQNNPLFNTGNILYVNSMIYYLLNLKKIYNYSELVDPVLDILLRKITQKIDNSVELDKNWEITLDLFLSLTWENPLIDEFQSKYQRLYDVDTDDKQDFDLDILRQELLYFSSSKQNFEVNKIHRWIDERLDTILDYNPDVFCRDIITVGLWTTSKVYETEAHSRKVDAINAGI
ncbi:lanthionine synthetase LanC family protein [Dysgonomonas termitidis]|uniref:Lanthionine synthetase LanC family protein n=1 Tax=Dysgonomonas termitidis TaxID=1516126 RepID=A0ABV9KRE0_9BACT